jgi:hypothetical protein
MPVDVLVKRSGVPRPTVFRILRGKIDKVRFGYVQQVAGVLGIAFGRPPVDPEDLCRQEAVKKARLLRSLTQGTMGLEAQAVSDDVLDDLEKKTVAKLLASKGRKLWGS